MRIAHLEPSPNWGGQELRVAEQTRWLNDHGHPTWIIARPGSAIADWARNHGLPLKEIPLRGSLHPWAWVKLRRFVAAQKIDILDCHGGRSVFYGALIKAFSGTKVIHSRHVTNRIKTSPLRSWAWRHGNHGIITTARMIRDMILQEKLSSPEKVFAAPAGVDSRRFHPQLDGSRVRTELGIPADHTVVANIGMIRPDKGQDVYVEACKLLLEAGLPVTCLQVGEATRGTLEFKQHIAGLAGPHFGVGIRFLGYREDIENYLAAADIVVVASVGTEAQTRLVSQAFLMKRNVVATRVGGLPEMITHGETGILCEPRDPRAISDAVELLMADSALRQTLREQAFTYAMKFMTFDRMMDQMCRFYQRLLDDFGKGTD